MHVEEDFVPRQELDPAPHTHTGGGSYELLESGLSPPPPPPGPSPPTHTQGEGGGDLLRSQNLDQGFPRIKFRGVLPEQGPRGAHWKLGFGGVGWMGGDLSMQIGRRGSSQTEHGPMAPHSAVNTSVPGAKVNCTDDPEPA